MARHHLIHGSGLKDRLKSGAHTVRKVGQVALPLALSAAQIGKLLAVASGSTGLGGLVSNPTFQRGEAIGHLAAMAM